MLQLQLKENASGKLLTTEKRKQENRVTLSLNQRKKTKKKQYKKLDRPSNNWRSQYCGFYRFPDAPNLRRGKPFTCLGAPPGVVDGGGAPILNNAPAPPGEPAAGAPNGDGEVLAAPVVG